MFEDLIPMDENVLYQAIQQPLETDTSGLFKQASAIFDQYFSIDSDSYVGSSYKSDTMMPERPSNYKDAMRNSPVFENEHYHLSFDNGVLLRWVSRDILKFIVPVVYFQELIEKEKTKIKDKERALNYAFIAKPVPTAAELESCRGLKGIGVWDRSGTWICECRIIQDKDYTGDMFGPYLFKSYNDWLRWESDLRRQMNAARRNNDTILVDGLKKAKNHTIKQLLNEVK